MHEGVRHGDLPDDYSSEANYRSYVNRAIGNRLRELDAELSRMALQLARARFRDGFCERPIDVFREIKNDLINKTMTDVWDEIEESWEDNGDVPE